MWFSKIQEEACGSLRFMIRLVILYKNQEEACGCLIFRRRHMVV